MIFDMQNDRDTLRAVEAEQERMGTEIVAAAQRLDAMDVSLQQTQDATWYVQRDHRRVLLGGNRILNLWGSDGLPVLRELLVAWARAFTAQEPDSRDWTGEIERALVFVLPAPPSGTGDRRLVVDLCSKLARDELCS